MSRYFFVSFVTLSFVAVACSDKKNSDPVQPPPAIQVDKEKLRVPQTDVKVEPKQDEVVVEQTTITSSETNVSTETTSKTSTEASTETEPAVQPQPATESAIETATEVETQPAVEPTPAVEPVIQPTPVVVVPEPTVEPTPVVVIPEPTVVPTPASTFDIAMAGTWSYSVSSADYAVKQTLQYSADGTGTLVTLMKSSPNGSFSTMANVALTSEVPESGKILQKVTKVNGGNLFKLGDKIPCIYKVTASTRLDMVCGEPNSGSYPLSFRSADLETYKKN